MESAGLPGGGGAGAPGGDGGQPSARVQALLEVLGRHPGGLGGPELLSELRRRWPRLSPAQLQSLIGEAGGAVVDDGGRFRAAAPQPAARGRSGSLRAVAFDLEAVPRLVTTAPYVERAVWQVGAVRFGRDAAWVAANPRLVAWIELPPGFAVANPRAAAVHGARQRPTAAVWGELAAFCVDADVLVAFNGTGLDFGALDDACDAAGVRRIDNAARVDALYLAYAWWPIASSHRLRPLAAEVGVDVSDLRWHDAGDDATALARLVTHGAATVTGSWSSGRLGLVASVGATSPAWGLAFDLAGAVPPASVPMDEATVGAVVEGELSGRAPLRPSRAPRPLAVPAAWRGPDGAVDPYLLSAAINPTAARRAAQDRMAAEIRLRFPDGPDLAVEAPTGTGKSLAALAAAIDWLASSPDRRVIFATHTKQLQAQLAADVEALAHSAPTLLSHTSLVKGAANRLSVRALVNVCADLSAAGLTRRGVLGEVGFAELVVFLLLRLLSDTPTMVAALEARSVDTADVPAFFSEYSAGRWGAYLGLLSQAAAGEYTDPAGLGAHTRNVVEHLDACRLVIANHALVFAHLDDLAQYAPTTLLIVDEAHAAEGSATEAFSSTLSYQQVERAAQLLTAWAARPDASAALRSISRNLEGTLDSERPVRSAMAAVDRLSGATAGEHPRTATLASPFSGDAGAPAARRLMSEMGAIARLFAGASRALAGWFAANGAGISRRDRDRYAELVSRVRDVAAGAAGVVGDVDAVLGTTFLSPPGPPPPRRGGNDAGPGTGAPGGNGPAPAGTVAVAAAAPAEPAPIDDLDADHGGGADEAAPDTDDAGPDATADPDGGAPGDAAPAPAGTVGNRVVWISEQPGSELGRGMRRYRFELRSSPIRLPADHNWARFRAQFGRTVFTSATLTVAGGWDYLLDRLGITDCDTLSLPGPFDYVRQALLVCLADFPSWSEHTEAAMRTVAHQLVGYATETAAAGRTPGAMVLTTATSTAAGIADHLAAYTAAAGLDLPMAAAPIYGNRRSVESYRSSGGWLVGTKGLWAGVDIPEPDRTRIVWVNKIPFAPFADPLVAARRAEVAARAAASGHPDPDAAATEEYYLPLGAVELRQAVGRLIRSPSHRGVIVISDRKLAGSAATRRLYRRILLGSLDPGLLVANPATGEPAGGNVVTMVEGWRRVWEFLAAGNDIDPARLADLCTPAALDSQTLLAETRAIRAAELTVAEVAAHRAAGTLEAEVIDRTRRVGGLLRFEAGPLVLRAEQEQAIAAVARGEDLVALLPTGFGKSYCFQLPALVLPGVTIVVSPLVALMADQALELNRAIGGAVRALVSPLPESSSRAGRQEVAEQLTGAGDHGIKLVYVSPERFAHRQFRDWVRAGIAAGRVARIVFDEAHTAIQWGDDFRPAYKRLATALGGLRTAGSGRLPVSAFTATANRAVREGLRTALFGLPPVPGPGGDPAGFASIAANPIRPELAVYRVQLAAGGPISVARYVEAVFDALDTIGGHAVFYCLTVREVDALWAHLRDYAGPAQAPRIRRFHGRLAEAEKASVLTDFREAPAAGDEGFAPMVVVATSAFGLGIDRGDIRCVLVTSPPTDLAALYQQIGRAGRDAAGRLPGPGDRVNAGVALATRRGFRTVEFLTRDLPPSVLSAAATAVLASGGLLDARAAGDRLIAAEVAAGRMSVDVAAREATRDRYRTAVVRALAALADAGGLDDLGDLPATVRITPGEVPPPAGADPSAVFARAVRAWVAANPARAARADVGALHAHLASVGAADPDDPAATWSDLVELHHAGVCDVSAAPNRSWLTALRIHTGTVPAAFAAAVGARRARAAAELAELRAWYGAGTVCANQGLADYFAPTRPGTVPAGTCSTDACRCSACWAAGAGGSPTAVLEAVLHPAPRPASANADRLRQARLDQAVEALLWANPAGLGPRMIWRCLRGEDTYFDIRERRRRPLRPGLLYHRLFGSRPGLRDQAVLDSLARLAAAGVALADGGRWCHSARAAARAAAAAAAGTAGGGAGP